MNQPIFPDRQEIEIDVNNLTINVGQVLSGLGMKRTDADDYLMNLIHELSIQSIKLAHPRAGFSIFKNPSFKLGDKVVCIAEQEFRLGKTITGMLKKSESVLLFSATIGRNVELFSKQQMNEGNALEGFIVDLIGSELVESATDYLHNYLDDLAKSNGYGLTNRYSPGYCNWPVSDQHALFNLLAGVNCGIVLNDSSLMSPVKSVSGIIGIGKGLRRIDYKCRLCDDEKCILRHQFEHQ